MGAVDYQYVPNPIPSTPSPQNIASANGRRRRLINAYSGVNSHYAQDFALIILWGFPRFSFFALSFISLAHPLSYLSFFLSRSLISLSLLFLLSFFPIPPFTRLL